MSKWPYNLIRQYIQYIFFYKLKDIQDFYCSQIRQTYHRQHIILQLFIIFQFILRHTQTIIAGSTRNHYFLKALFLGQCQYTSRQC